MSQIELVYPLKTLSVELSFRQKKMLMKIVDKWQHKFDLTDEEKRAIVLLYTVENNPDRAIVIAQAYLYHSGVFTLHVSLDNPEHQKPFASFLPK